MKAGLTLLIVLALGALAANFLLQDNGYVLINFRGYVIEMSVPILAFLAVLTYILVRFLVRLWRAPRQLGEVAARRRVRKAGERITQGYIEIGQVKSIRCHLINARRVHTAPHKTERVPTLVISYNQNNIGRLCSHQ